MKRIKRQELINRLVENEVDKLEVTINYGIDEDKVKIIVDNNESLIVSWLSYEQIVNTIKSFTNLKEYTNYFNHNGIAYL